VQLAGEEAAHSQTRGGAAERGDAIGIEELRGYYHIYGRHYQAMMYHKTTRKIADYVVQEIKSGKEMYRLNMDGQETTYKDPEDPAGKDATPGKVAVYKMLYEEARRIGSSIPMISSRSSS
jgi:hypothetical protein